MRKDVLQRKLRRMYVLLDRISRSETPSKDSSAETPPKKTINDWVGQFQNIFQKRLEKLSRDKLKLKAFFTQPEVLNGKITPEDRNFDNLDDSNHDNREHSPLQGETLLHRAINLLSSDNIHAQTELMKIIEDTLIKETPFLLEESRVGTDYAGQTPLHLAVLKEDMELVKKMIEVMEKKTLDTVAIGDNFQGTIMMAGSALSVAAATLNQTIFKVLADKANLFQTNKRNENVCHSLITYAVFRPDEMEAFCEMLDYILKCKWMKERSLKKIEETQKLLTMENKDGLNPLQLATKYRLHEIFKKLYEYEVYCCPNPSDRLLEVKKYDISEIETISPDDILSAGEAEDETKPKQSIEGVPREIEEEKRPKHVSILPAILLQDQQSAYLFLDFPPVLQVIEGKWHAYSKIIYLLGVFHLLIVCLLTASSIERSKLKNIFGNDPNTTRSNQVEFVNRVTEDRFVTAVGGIAAFSGLIYIILEFLRIAAGFGRKQVRETSFLTKLSLPHSNLVNRLLFVVFSVSVIIDFILAASKFSWYENYFLIVAVITGWYLTLFFLQMIEPFSFFTSLIQTVTLDLVKFAVVMLVMLLGFSTAMFMVMQGANTSDDTFDTYHSTVVKMMSFMLGIGDLDGLIEARQPIAAISVFLLFVLLTTILLLNALIAIMSSTCSELLSGFGNVSAYSLHYRLQKLSVILLIEDMIPFKVLKTRVGQVEKRRRYVGDHLHYNVKRCMVDHTTLAGFDGKENEHESADITSTFNFLRQPTSMFRLFKRIRKNKSVDVYQPRASEKSIDKTKTLGSSGGTTQGTNTLDISIMEVQKTTGYTHRGT